MARKCSTCQHVKRADIDRRLAAGEPGNQIAQHYGLTRPACIGTGQTVLDFHPPMRS